MTSCTIIRYWVSCISWARNFQRLSRFLAGSTSSFSESIYFLARFPRSVDVIVFCDGRGGSRTAATSKMERFVIIVNGFQPLTIITKRSILDVAAVLDPPLHGFLCRLKWMRRLEKDCSFEN